MMKCKTTSRSNLGLISRGYGHRQARGDKFYVTWFEQNIFLDSGPDIHARGTLRLIDRNRNIINVIKTLDLDGYFFQSEIPDCIK